MMYRKLGLAGFIVSLSVIGVLYQTKVSEAQEAQSVGESPYSIRGAAFRTASLSAAQTGRARVIVGLDVEFIPEGYLTDDRRAGQRDSIQRSGRSFFDRHSDLDLHEHYIFEAIPFVFFEAGASSIDALEHDLSIKSIQLDVAEEPHLAESSGVVQATTANANGWTGNGWSVAVLDTGVNKNHTFLTGRINSEACYSSNVAGQSATSVCPGGVTESTAVNSGLNCDPAVSGCAHGTHVAGISSGNSASFKGVAPSSNVIAIQVFSRVDSTASCGSNPSPCALSFVSDQIKGLERVLALSGSINIAAANMSLGGGQFTSNCDATEAGRKAAIDNLRSVGIATAISSGNNGFTNAIGSPACISSAVSVGSTGDGSLGATLDVVSSFSNSASFLNLLAPGQWINSSVAVIGSNSTFQNYSGTSMAAPHVAGAWALIKHKAPTTSVTSALSALTSTGLNVLDTRNSITKPRIRINDALNIFGSPGSVQLSSSTYSIGEGAGSLVVTITRTGGTGAFNVNYATANGTAIAGSDYTATSGTMSFAAADTSRTFSVPIINDSLVEGTETFSVSLNSPTNGATLGSPSSATVSIIDNDTSCTYSLNPTNLTFGSSGGSGSFSVNTQAGCSWATSVNAPLSEIRENRENLFLSEVENSPDGDAPQIAPQAVFLNSTPITVADRTSSTSAPGLGSPYPSNISVSGMTGTITSVDLSLNGVTHTFPADLDVILVGPGGQRVLVMSDAGAGNDISNTNLTISGSASTAMTSTGTITSGTYLPSNYAGNTTIEPGGIDNFPAPGPGSANHPTALSVFNGLAANGTWSLYVVDDESVDVGSINGGWALGITTTGGGSGWISITSGSSGTGSGTVNYSVSMNTSSAQRTGSITTGGQTHTVTQNGVVSGIRKPYDFDGDSRSDMSIYRPSNGQWWWMRSSNGVSGAVTFGSSTDIITPGDFTGDNRADHAFFRPSTGFWYVLRSENFSFYAGQFGTNGDIPAPGDFDADGRDDLTVFRPSNSTWYSLLSNGGTAINQFGSAGDRPVTADYDGDGRADRAIFRPALGQWWIQRTTLGTVAYSFGVSTDRTTVGDHTGDGKADVAFFRPSTGTWYVLRSENNSFYAFPFGLSTDVPTPGDYDGDGKTDGAVFRPSNNTWYINRSSGGTTIQLFGAAGDTAVPSAFVR